MNTIGIQQAVQDLPQIIQYTLDNCEETVIVSERGVVVMVDQREWKNMQETLRLFRDKKSLNALLEGHRNRESGILPDSVSDIAFVEVSSDNNKIIIVPLSKPRYNLEEMLNGISEDNLHKEVDTGIPQGNEIW